MPAVECLGKNEKQQTHFREVAMRSLQKKNLLIAGFLFLALLAAPGAVFAADAKEAVQLSAASSMADNLAALTGKTVTVNIAGGQPVTGIVKNVKGNLLHLEKLSQKEFYDGLVSIDKISSIEVRVR